MSRKKTWRVKIRKSPWLYLPPSRGPVYSRTYLINQALRNEGLGGVACLNLCLRHTHLPNWPSRVSLVSPSLHSFTTLPKAVSTPPKPFAKRLRKHRDFLVISAIEKVVILSSTNCTTLHNIFDGSIYTLVCI
jgi:hypothetical protein